MSARAVQGDGTEMIGPIAKHAILGAVFGAVALPIFGVLTGQLAAGIAIVAGLAGGSGGGALYGFMLRRRDA